MAQISNTLLSKFTLGQFGLPFVLAQDLKHIPDMVKVIFIRLAVNQYVVEKNQSMLAQNRSEGSIHGMLKRGWRASEAKCHYLEFIVAVVRLKSCFWSFSRR